MKHAVTFLCLICVLILSSCTASNEIKTVPKDFPANVENIVITKKPETIVCFSADYADILCELGFSGMIKAVSDDCTDKRLSAVKSGTAISPDINKLSKYPNSLFISDSPLSSSVLQRLSDLNMTVLTINPPTTFDQLKNVYVSLATAAAGRIEGPKTGERAYQKIQDGISEIKSKITHGRFSYVFATSLDSNEFATPDTYENTVLSVFADNAVTSGADYKTPLNIKKLNPGILFLYYPYEAENAREVKSLKKLKALQEGQVVTLKPRWFEHKSAKLINDVKKIAQTLYPDIDF